MSFCWLVKRIFALIVLSFSLTLHAQQQCAAAFVDGLTNSSTDGTIDFYGWGTLHGNPDNQLASSRVNSYSWYNHSCDHRDCVAGGEHSVVAPLYAQFSPSSATEDIYLAYQTQTIVDNDYRYVTVTDNSTLDFSDQHTSYHIVQLWIDSYSTVNLTAGDYYIDTLVVNWGGKINVVGSGTVRLFVRSQSYLGYDVEVNGGASGDPSKLFLYHFGESDPTLWLLNGAKVSGLLYSAGSAYVGGWFPAPWQTSVNGGISAVDQITVTGTSEVSYDQSAPAQTDFGNNCLSQAQPLHHIEIIHDGQGSTCATETVTLKACADQSCAQLYPNELSLELTANGLLKQSLTFSGQSELTLTHSSAEALTLAVENITKTPIQSYDCDSGAGNSCVIDFTDLGCSQGNSCAATFIDGASNSSNSGWVYFYDHGYIRNSPDNILHTTDLYDGSNNFPSCLTADCSINDAVVPSLDAKFVSTKAKTSFPQGGQRPAVISLGAMIG